MTGQFHSFESLERNPYLSIVDSSDAFTIFQARVGYVVVARHADRATLFLQGDDANSVITLIEQGTPLDDVIDPYVGTVTWDEALPPAPPELLVIA
jgi:hypothetical protein